MSYCRPSQQPPMETLRRLLDAEAYRHGMTDAVSLGAFHEVLGLLDREPSARGEAWAQWCAGAGSVYLQAGNVEFESDHLRVPHPRIWIVGPTGHATCIEPPLRDARERRSEQTVEFIRDALMTILTAAPIIAESQEKAA